MDTAAQQLPAAAPIQVEPADVKTEDAKQNSWVEYEDVLCGCEKYACDCAEACFRCCLNCRCSDPDKKADATERPRRFSGWEGMAEDVPERYQRWEGIRERNVITSNLAALCGRGRKQPSRVERLHLLILYAAVWFLCYAISLRRRGNPCRKAWVEECVPASLGGRCSNECATAAILDKTPERFSNFQDVIDETQFGLDVDKAACVSQGSVQSPCDVGMCADEGERTCFDKADGTTGFCRCDPTAFRVVYDIALYCLAFKVCYLPYWYLFVMDTDKKCGVVCSRVISFSVIVLYTIIFALGLVILATFMGTVIGVYWEILWWLATFSVLCCTEVVKAFIFGFIVGTYVITPIFGRMLGACVEVFIGLKWNQQFPAAKVY